MIDMELKKKILRAVIKEGRKMTGQRFTYNGKKYICQMNGCAWDPITYPQGWQEVQCRWRSD